MTSESMMSWAFAFFLVFVWSVLQARGKTPSVSSLQDLASAINSRGGNIIVLLGLTLIFHLTGMRFIYYVIGQIELGKVTASDAIVALGVTYITGTCFGGAFGALLKTMTGESSKARSTDDRNGDGGTTTVKTTVQKPGQVPISVGSNNK